MGQHVEEKMFGFKAFGNNIFWYCTKYDTWDDKRETLIWEATFKKSSSSLNIWIK